MVNNASGPKSSGSTATPNTGSNRPTASRDTTNTTSSNQPTVESQEHELTFAGEAVKQIEPIIELFRTDKIKKSQAILRIGQILAAEPTGNEHLKSSALEQYAATLDRIEALTASANKHGTQVIRTGPMHERRIGEFGK